MERIQKVLAAAGYGSRRNCEELIAQGRVTVDGETIRELGYKVDAETQKICCDGELVKPQKKVHYLFYKPRGVLCTNDQREDNPIVIDYFRLVSYRLFCVGRLDKESEGLILVTNDGEFAQRILHPKYQIPRVYQIHVRGVVKYHTLNQLREGVWISEGKIVPTQVRLQNVKYRDNYSVLEVTICEGKNRELRRIFAKVGHPIKKLARIRVGHLQIGELAPGSYRSLTEEEIQEFFSGRQRRPRYTKFKTTKKPSPHPGGGGGNRSFASKSQKGSGKKAKHRPQKPRKRRK